MSKGSKIGLHILNSGAEWATIAAARGVTFPVVKAVGNIGALAGMKAINPAVVTIGRFEIDGYIGEGANGIERVESEAEYKHYLDALFAPIEAAYRAHPYVDFWELTNEPSPKTPDNSGYRKLGELYNRAIARAEKLGIRLACFGLNAGTPEWAEMQALAATGVFGRIQRGGHIVTLHEGIFWNHDTKRWDPIDKWWPGTLPGMTAADGSPHGGALCFRYRHLYDLLEDRGEVCPLVISEIVYGHGDGEDVVDRAEWYDTGARADWYVLGHTPFTVGGSGEWASKSYDYAMPHIINYMELIQDEPNAQAPTTPPPDTGDPMPEPTNLADALEAWLDSRPHFFYEAALHAAIVKDGNWALTTEGRKAFGGISYAVQGARTPDDSKRYIYYAPDGDWGNVKRHRHRGHNPAPAPPQPTIPPPPAADGFPFDKLRLHAPALKRGARQDFQAFGAPREYDLNNDGKPEPFYHEGLDVTTYWADPVYAAYDGIVQTIRNNPGGWGHYLWIEHEIDGHPFHTAYCHLSADYVEEGQHVKAGEKIAAAGNTGNVFPRPTPDDPYRGTHLHFTLQVWEHGKTGGMWVPQHVVNPEPFIDWNTAAPPPPVAPGLKYDLAGYIAGDRVVRLANSRGTRELCWYKRVGSTVYFVKNSGYEELSWDANSVYRGVDTTQGGGLGYCQYSQPGRKWAIWIPRHVAVGESFSRSPYVVHKRLSDCTVTAQGWHTSTITVVAHHTRYTVPESGQQVGNTIELQGAQHGERYWYAYGMGLVRFSGPGFVSWLHEVVDQERGDEPIISRCF